MAEAARVVQPFGRPPAGYYTPHHNVVVTYNAEGISVYRLERADLQANPRQSGPQWERERGPPLRHAAGSPKTHELRYCQIIEGVRLLDPDVSM